MKMTRKNLFYGALLLLLLLMVLSCQTNSPSVFLLCDTPPEPQMDALQKFIQARGYAVEQLSQKDFEGALSQKHPIAIVVYVHKPFVESVENQLIEYCTDGGKVIALHHAIASAKINNKRWLPFVGIRLSKELDAQYPWTVLHHGRFTMVNLNPHHFITSNNIHYDQKVRYISSDVPSDTSTYQGFTFKDTELLMNQMFIDGREKTVLFGYKFTDSANGKVYMADRAGWLLKKGRGYLFYFLPGHNVSDFENEIFCQIILNCLVWEE